MGKLVAEAFFLPVFWLFVFVFITAIGFVLTPFKSQKGTLSGNLFTSFWYGLCMLVAFLQVWNLFLPLNIYTWIGLLPLAVWGCMALQRSGLFVGMGRAPYPASLLGILILIFLIVSSLDHSFIYDSAVYHFYTVKWFNHYPVTPGMGNLFIYLGLNQSYFLFPSFLNGLWGNYAGACSTNGLLAVVICAEIIVRNLGLLDRKAKLSFLAVFQLLFLPLCINIGVQNLSSPTPDVLVNLLTFKVLCDVISCLETKKITFQDIFLLSFYCLLGMTMKLSFMGIAAGISLVLMYWAFSEKLCKPKLIAKAITLLLILLLPWLIRGIISSGYIGFPISAFGMPVDWKMPKSTVDEFAAFIKGFARSHFHGQEGIAAAYGYSWLGSWIKRMAGTPGFIVPVLLFFVCGIAIKIRKLEASKLVFILLPVFISILIWFFTAPGVRFALFTFWALGLAPLAFYIYRTMPNWKNAFLTFIFTCSLLIMLRNWNTDPQALGDVPKQDASVFTTRSGLQIYTIQGTPPGDNWQIGDCIIPCSVYPDSNLVLRGESMKEGFRIEVNNNPKP